MTADTNLKVGLAVQTLGQIPINGLRHPPEGDTTGWYIWGGETLDQSDDFFQPIHWYHLSEMLPEVMRFLHLAPGWRFLIAEGYEDTWFDPSLLDIH